MAVIIIIIRGIMIRRDRTTPRMRRKKLTINRRKKVQGRKKKKQRLERVIYKFNKLVGNSQVSVVEELA